MRTVAHRFFDFGDELLSMASNMDRVSSSYVLLNSVPIFTIDSKSFKEQRMLLRGPTTLLVYLNTIFLYLVRTIFIQVIAESIITIGALFFSFVFRKFILENIHVKVVLISQVFLGPLKGILLFA